MNSVTILAVYGFGNGMDHNANDNVLNGAAGADTLAGTTTWQVTSADGPISEVITFANGAAIDASDFVFV